MWFLNKNNKNHRKIIPHHLLLCMYCFLVTFSKGGEFDSSHKIAWCFFSVDDQIPRRFDSYDIQRYHLKYSKFSDRSDILISLIGFFPGSIIRLPKGWTRRYLLIFAIFLCVVYWLHFQKWMFAKKDRKEKPCSNCFWKNSKLGFTENESVESLIVMMDVTEVR